MPKYLLLDLANTLVHKEPVYDFITLKLEELLNAQINRQEVIRIHKLISEVTKFPPKTSPDFYFDFNKKVLRAFGAFNISEKTIIEIIEKGKKTTWQKYEDTKILKKLKVPMGIVTNWDETANQKVKSLFGNIFEFIVSSKILGTSKPNPEIYQNAIDKTALDPKQIIYIGDSVELDIEPAIKLGMKTILIDRYNLYPYFSGPKISSLNEIVKYIN